MSRNHIASATCALAFAGLLTLLGLAASGCIAVGGSDKYAIPTLGRQLQDLKVARDTGAVSDAEYQDAKSRLINGQYGPKK